MPEYCVNENSDSGGYHEVHSLETDACHNLPDVVNRKNSGWFVDCKGAIEEAKKHFTEVDGCAFCAADCHSR